MILKKEQTVTLPEIRAANQETIKGDLGEEETGRVTQTTGANVRIHN